MKNNKTLVEVLRQSPKTMQKLKDFAKKNLVNLGEIIQKESISIPELKELEVELPNINTIVDQFITEDSIINTVSFNHRVLYDFFDRQDKVIEVSLKGSFFSYKIYSPKATLLKEDDGSLFTDRTSCEMTAFIDIIELTENE
jgi:hypothetical protein